MVDGPDNKWFGMNNPSHPCHCTASFAVLLKKREGGGNPLELVKTVNCKHLGSEILIKQVRKNVVF